MDKIWLEMIEDTVTRHTHVNVLFLKSLKESMEVKWRASTKTYRPHHTMLDRQSR